MALEKAPEHGETWYFASAVARATHRTRAGVGKYEGTCRYISVSLMATRTRKIQGVGVRLSKKACVQ